MKEIKAVIQPARLTRLREALRNEPGFLGMTVADAHGCGRPVGQPADFRDELLDFSRRVRVDMVAEDDHVEALVAVIHRVAHTGQKGDGVVWVTPVETLRRLREP